MTVKNNPEALGAIAFAERILILLDQGAYNTTYKFAVLLGLMDLVVEKSNKDGTLADMVTTCQLAEKIIEIYWNHVGNFGMLKKVPMQGKSGQAEIVGAILEFREATNFSSFCKSKVQYEEKFKSLLNKVEKKIIEMPLPRVQYFGNQEHRFIYDISWSKSHPAALNQVTAYQSNVESQFDNRINLLPGVSDYLVNLNGLLRPLIQRKWAIEVAKINNLEESRLEKFLFGFERTSAAQLAPSLREAQNNKCFYCKGVFSQGITKKPEVDHFVPWVRFPNDGLANYVLAHADCNNSKSDHIASIDHLSQWLERNHSAAIVSDLQLMAAKNQWELRMEESLNISKILYLRLQPDVELWQSRRTYQRANKAEIAQLLAGYAA